LRDYRGLNFKEACDELNIDKGWKYKNTDGIKKKSDSWVPKEKRTPKEKWQQKAKLLIEISKQALIQNKLGIDWLQNRGISLDGVKKYGLGWNMADKWEDRSLWGMPYEEKKSNNLKIPKGLIIPCFDEGEPARIRIRTGEKINPYHILPGSSLTPLILGKEPAYIIIVESELDAMLIDELAGDLITTIALGNAQAKPDNLITNQLRMASHIMVSLDDDEAGAENSRWWLKRFSQTIRWPCIEGKDPGESYQAGIDIRDWVKAGLPDYHPIKIPEPVTIDKTPQPELAEPLTENRTEPGEAGEFSNTDLSLLGVMTQTAAQTPEPEKTPEEHLKERPEFCERLGCKRRLEDESITLMLPSGVWLCASHWDEAFPPQTIKYYQNGCYRIEGSCKKIEFTDNPERKNSDEKP